MFDSIINLIGNTVVESWQVLGQMSPYLLFGFLVAGVLSIVFSPEWIERHLGGRGFGPVVKASLLGVPLPLCSCGVIPVSASIRRHGASRAATVSFLLSTPQTGVDSIAVTWGLLGPIFGVFRPIAALVTGLLGGGLVQLFGEKDPLDDGDQPLPKNHCGESCCTEKGKRHFILRALRFGFLTLPRDIGKPLLIGVLIAGAIGALVDRDELRPYLGNQLLSILAMMAVGIPLYVCATASVPIAVGFIHAGFSPGAALAFLIAGPATNAATISTTWKQLGKRSALLYLLTIALSAVVCGYLLDWLTVLASLHIPELTTHAHHHIEDVGWVSSVWAIGLLSVIGVSYFWPNAAADAQERERAHENGDSPAATETSSLAPQRQELAVNGMACSHCAAAVTRAIRECSGVRSVEVDLKNGRAMVEGVNLDSEKIIEAVKSLGYEVEGVRE
ncbi:MAG: SO_0444 family Cu/Zn efflux transporter [Pirellulales bacterium]|nr:SO_0444 family Cu/Zn efflux transporter [Pirellulales bacterium]